MYSEDMREYQKKTATEVMRRLGEGKSVVAVLPTGAGKTRTASEIIRFAVNRGARVLWLCHRDFLSDQAQCSIERACGVKTGRIQAGRKSDLSLQVQVATDKTLWNRMNTGRVSPEDFDLCVVDEAHHCIPTTIMGKIAMRFKGDGKFLVGLTATPTRLDGRPIKDVFDSIVVGAKPLELIEKGYLIDPDCYSRFTPDLSKSRFSGRDYNQEDLEKLLDTQSSNDHVVEEYLRIASGKKFIAYCVSLRHAEHLKDAFVRKEIDCDIISYRTKKQERERIMTGFKSGTILGLINIAVATEGFDDPDTSAIILLRATTSTSLYLQMVGRGMRPSSTGEKMVLIDHSGNIQKHGFPQEDRDWEKAFLKGMKPQKGENGKSPVKTCSDCFFVVKIGESVCPNCGKSFSRESVEKEILNLKLGKLTFDKKKKKKTYKLKYLEIIEEIRGYKRKWSWATYKSVQEGRLVSSKYFDRLYTEVSLYCEKEGISRKRDLTEKDWNYLYASDR